MRKLFRKRTLRPTKAELRNITKYYDKLTEDVPDKAFMDKMLSEEDGEPWHYIRLLMLADHLYPMGKTKAIMFSFKLGYLEGRRTVSEKVLRHFEGKAVE